MAAGTALFETLKRTCIYETQAPAREVLRDLERISTLGRSFARSRRRWGWLALLSLIGGIGMVIVAGSQLDRPDSGAGGVLILAIVVLLFAVYAFLRYRAYKRKCFDERMQNFLGRTLQLVGADMGPDVPVRVRMDLRPHDFPEKLSGEGPVGEWKVKYYTSPWLTLGGKLLDGTAFQMQVTTLLQARRKTKKNARGKYKMKTKRKEALRVRVQLRVKPSRHPALEELARTARPALKLPAGTAVRRFESDADSLLLEAGTGEWGNDPPQPGQPVSGPHLVAMMFLSLYHILNLSREIAKRQPSGGEV